MCTRSLDENPLLATKAQRSEVQSEVLSHLGVFVPFWRHFSTGSLLPFLKNNLVFYRPFLISPFQVYDLVEGENLRPPLKREDWGGVRGLSE
jgi:hypothetical protein